ncbi:MAG: hypothetical protein HPY85_03930 [Anaerolineae bacterium]|jgi:hypothetical protein|nr:hypothetical protein [Anaerolineae bacterium]
MDAKIRKAVCDKIYEQFPEMAGITPKIQPRPNNQVLMIFETKVTVGTGQMLKRAVRVVVDEKGKVVKVTTSR